MSRLNDPKFVHHHWTDRTSVLALTVAERTEILDEAASIIEEEGTDPQILMRAALHDPDLRISSTAALSFAALTRPEGNDVTTGCRILLDRVQRSGAENPGALYGGLLGVGDRRVVEYLFRRRDLLRPEDLDNLVKCQTGYPQAPVLDFYLDWLETLPGDRDDQVFGTLCAGLSRERIHARIPMVAETWRVFPAWVDPEHPVRVEEVWMLDEYAEIMAHRLRALQEREAPPRAMDHVLRVWGLE